MEFLGVDILIWLVLLGMMLVPFIVILWELGERRKYPIKVEVTYSIGSKSPQGKNTASYDDRVGLRPVTKDGKQTGAKEWKFRSSQKPIQKFSYDFVGKKKGLFGKYDYARVQSVTGEKGEEFYGVMFDAELHEFKPIFDTDRTIAAFRLREAIRERNKVQSWLQEHIFQLAMGGLALLCVIMLFLNFLQLTEIAKNFNNAATAWQQASTNYQNYTTTLSNQNKTVPNLGGIPFGFGG